MTAASVAVSAQAASVVPAAPAACAALAMPVCAQIECPARLPLVFRIPLIFRVYGGDVGAGEFLGRAVRLSGTVEVN
ncbi:hypothetical protein GCM10023083_52440 [Streptomyces phyllanthi]